MIECNDYIKYEASLLKSNKNNDAIAKLNNFKLFNKCIRNCENKYLKFKSNDLCLNGGNCQILNGIDHKTSKFDCKCPAKKSLKCGIFCTTSSNVCDNLKSIMKNKNFFKKIKNCGNHNTTHISFI